MLYSDCDGVSKEGETASVCWQTTQVLQSPQPPQLFWITYSLLVCRWRVFFLGGQNGPNVKLIIHLHVMPRLRIGVFIPSLFRMSTSPSSPRTTKSWYAIQSFELGTKRYITRMRRIVIPCYITYITAPCFTVNHKAMLYCVILWTTLLCHIMYSITVVLYKENITAPCFTVNHKAVLHCEQHYYATSCTVLLSCFIRKILQRRVIL
jgi:hypothetical protein